MSSRIVAALSLLILAGCSAIASFDGLVEEQGATDGGVDGTARDGSSPADGSVSSADGSATDAGVTDALPPTADAGDAPYCATHPGHTFCDDFDPTSTLGGRWTTTVHIGSAGVVTSGFVSPPRGMLATSPDNDAGVSTENDIEKDFVASKIIDLEAAVKVTLGATGCDFMGISFVPSNNSLYSECYFDVNYRVNVGTSLEAQCTQADGGSYYASSTIAATQPNWDRVHLSVDVSSSKVTGTVAGTSKQLKFPAGLSTTKLTALLGVLYKDKSVGNAVVRVDNVTVDTE